jgi:hypothetical protein
MHRECPPVPLRAVDPIRDNEDRRHGQVDSPSGALDTAIEAWSGYRIPLAHDRPRRLAAVAPAAAGAARTR